MASALLASRAEPLWGERKVYARKAPTNPNPNSKTIAIANPNPNPNPNLNTIELESVSPGVSDDWANSSSHEHHQKERNHGGYVTFNIAAYTKREMKDLKKRLLLELETVQNLRKRIESTNFPNKRPRTETPAAREAVAKMMKQCGQILGKLMKHKFSWIFNSPVDVVGLGLHDYNQIIKHPMDLGTVKTKLGKNLYSTPEEFESDVMLTFNNAITYNPQGHDVYVMAHKLRASFQKMFGNAYAKYNNERRKVIALAEQEMKWSADRDRCYEQRRPLPVPIHSVYSNTPTPEPVRRPDPMPMPAMQSISIPPSPVQASRPMPQSVEAAVPVVKTLPKPKARDLNKRNMTFEEKRKLSESLESLPQEKMDQVVQIMRRKNAALSQNDDEIEVDIEVLDKETLWELDRFVSNHRKTMCKAKRQQELEQNNRNFSAPVEEGNKSPGSEMTEALAPAEKTNKVEAVGMDEDIDIGEDIPTNNFPPVEIEKDAGYASGGGTSSSSSSSSGSSSSSDSGSSSDSDSDDDEAQSPNRDAKGKGSPG